MSVIFINCYLLCCRCCTQRFVFFGDLKRMRAYVIINCAVLMSMLSQKSIIFRVPNAALSVQPVREAVLKFSLKTAL